MQKPQAIGHVSPRGRSPTNALSMCKGKICLSMSLAPRGSAEPCFPTTSDGSSTRPTSEGRTVTGAARRRLRHQSGCHQPLERWFGSPRLVQEGNIVGISRDQAGPTVEVMVYDFGAITRRFPIDRPTPERFLTRS